MVLPFGFGFTLHVSCRGLAPLNPITEEFKKDVLKHLAPMRVLGLHAAADYLESWIRGEIEPAPLLEVRMTLESMVIKL